MKDDSVSLKALGTGIIFGRRIGISFLDTEVGIDLAKAFKPKAEESAVLPSATPLSQTEERILSIIAKAESHSKAFSGNSRWAAAGRQLRANGMVVSPNAQMN